MEALEYIWMNGKLVKWNDAKVHVLTHALHYATAVFEGIRAYNIDGKAGIFRLDEHVKRLFESANIYEMKLPYTQEEVKNAIKEVIKANNLNECYIRPLVYFGYGNMGVNPLGNPVEISIAVWKWGAYLGSSAKSNGIKCMVSTWHKIPSTSLPVMAKASANYANSVLAKIEAIKAGYDEAILTNEHGYVTEGTGENIFFVRDEEVVTPPTSSGLLRGITRDTVFHVLSDIGVKLRKVNISREELYLSNEVFLTGTAAEITPVVEVDKKVVGNGKVGPITQTVMKHVEDIVHGKVSKYKNWITMVE